MMCGGIVVMMVGSGRMDARRVTKRRAAELGIKIKIGCHTFRATGITAYMKVQVNQSSTFLDESRTGHTAGILIDALNEQRIVQSQQSRVKPIDDLLHELAHFVIAHA